MVLGLCFDLENRGELAKKPIIMLNAHPALLATALERLAFSFGDNSARSISIGRLASYNVKLKR
ncbi:MAG: hypothetical protein JST58_02175 [Bacteroidetes bacterium]|nr:hypothetical protein [Bacteroidota bacterium]